MKKQQIIGVLLAIIIIVLAAVTFFVPSGMEKITENYSVFGTTHSVTTQVNSTLFGAKTGNSQLASWSNISSSFKGTSVSGKINNGVDLVYGAIATLVLGIISALAWLVFSILDQESKRRKLKLTLPVLTGIFLLLTVVLYYIGVTSIFSAFLSYSSTSGISTSTSFGLLIGGYLIVAGIVLSFIGAAFSFGGKAPANKTA